MSDLVARLRTEGAVEVKGRLAEVLYAAADHITQLTELCADLLEWADHQADCLIHDDDICDCGYDALAGEWEQLRRG